MKSIPPPDYIIAREALKKMVPIERLAASLGLPTDPAHLFTYGGRYAKVSHTLARGSSKTKRGKSILITAMTPTPAGTGKTLTTVTLADALGRLLRQKGKRGKATFVLRQPSQGPTLGMKGGACGGGYSQVLPMEEINLHFTGDTSAVTQANNLLWAILMAYMQPTEKRKRVDPTSVEWTRAVDLCDRSLRRFLICPDGQIGKSDQTITGRAVITAASEIMAVLGLARDMVDLGERLSRIRVARHEDGSPVTVETLGVAGALQAVLKHAFNPNLVQTIAGTPGFIHTGPFANIAHGNSSLVALLLACRHADLVVTEAGFGSELGAQKFFDVVCRLGKIRPAAAVLVCSTRELKWQGGAKPRPINGTPLSRWRFTPDRQACRRGIDNLKAHVENLRRYGVRVVVGLNRFATDDPKEIEFCLSEIAGQTGVPAVAHTGHAEGVKGGMDLARKVLQEVEAGEGEESFRLLYPDHAPLRTKIETVATQIYRAAGVDYEPSASQALDEIERTYGSRLNVVLSKTQFSLSDDKSIRGVPRERTVRVTGVRYCGGAGWVTVLLGGVLLMPGMDFEKCAARRFALGEYEEAFGGFVVENLS